MDIGWVIGLKYMQGSTGITPIIWSAVFGAGGAFVLSLSMTPMMSMLMVVVGIVGLKLSTSKTGSGPGCEQAGSPWTRPVVVRVVCAAYLPYLLAR